MDCANAKLADLQTKVHVAKDRTNDFGGYNYRTAEGILSALKNAMPDGSSVIVTDTMQELAGQIFVSAEARITFSDGETHSATGHALHPLSKKGMDPSQITGAASSYARKYALAGLLALDDGSVDPDAAKQQYEEFDAATERDRIKHAIEGARTLSGLQKTWTDNSHDLARLRSQAEPMYNELVKAKDTRKDQLTPPDPAMQAPPEGADNGERMHG